MVSSLKNLLKLSARVPMGGHWISTHMVLHESLSA